MVVLNIQGVSLLRKTKFQFPSPPTHAKLPYEQKNMHRLRYANGEARRFCHVGHDKGLLSLLRSRGRNNEKLRRNFEWFHSLGNGKLPNAGF